MQFHVAIRSALCTTLLVASLLGSKVPAQSNFNDPYYSQQYAIYRSDFDQVFFESGSIGPATGSGVVVAVLDSGIRPNTDLPSATKILPGYDFVSGYNDLDGVDGRDGDAYDSYRCRDNSLNPVRPDGPPEKSTINFSHGTAVASVIAAKANNGFGIVGTAPEARILPVRVDSDCTATGEEDLIDALRWAAGISVSGTPKNNNPAHVINISLSQAGPCSNQLQAAINDVRARNISVVVAAGNRNSATLQSPATCKGVLVVGALTSTGSRWVSNTSTGSNFGSGVDVWAVGANVPVVDKKTTGENYVRTASGTSFAAPVVAGALALMRSRPSNFPLACEKESIVIETARQLPNALYELQAYDAYFRSRSMKNGVMSCFDQVE